MGPGGVVFSEAIVVGVVYQIASLVTTLLASHSSARAKRKSVSINILAY